MQLLYNFYYIYLCQPDQCDIKGYFLVEVNISSHTGRLNEWIISEMCHYRFLGSDKQFAFVEESYMSDGLSLMQWEE